MRKSIAAGLLLGTLISPAAFADTKTDLAKCAVMDGDLDRLSCYDAIAADLGVDGPQPVAVETEGTGKWQVSRTTNPIDDTETVTLFLQADSGTGTYGDAVGFVARCKSNSTDAYISWNAFLGDDSGDVYSDWKRVTIRVGDQPAAVQRWGISTDNEATFAPDWAGDLLKQMVKTNKMVAQVTPYSESPITAVFDTGGMRQAMKPLTEVCHWSLDEG